MITSLNDNRNLYIRPEEGSDKVLGARVKLENSNTPDGEYITKNEKYKYIVENNVITSVIHIKVHKLNDGSRLIVEQLSEYGIHVGCKVLKDNQLVDYDSFVIKEYGVRIYVRKSVVVNTAYLKHYKLTNGADITIEQRNEFNYKKGDEVLYDGDFLPDGKYTLVEHGSIFIKDGIIHKIGLPALFRLVIYYVLAILVIVIGILSLI